MYRFSPALVSYDRCTSFPCMAISCPFLRYLLAISASFPHITIWCHCVSSTFSPRWFLYVWVVALVNDAFCLPFLNVFISGSFLRRPIICSLFLMVFMTVNDYRFNMYFRQPAALPCLTRQILTGKKLIVVY